MIPREKVKTKEEYYLEQIRTQPKVPIKTKEEYYQEQIQTKKSFWQQAWEGVKTPFETVAGVVSPMVEFPAQIAATLYNQAMNPDMTWQEARQKGQEFAYNVGFQPTTPIAKTAKQTAWIPIEMALKPLQAGVKVMAQDDPEVEAMLETGLFTVLALGGGKVLAKPKASLAKAGKIMKDVGGEFGKRLTLGRQATRLWKEQAPPPTEAVARVIEAVKELKPERKEQELLYTKERGKRLAKAMTTRKEIKGEAGHYAEMAKFKGELPKVETAFESLRSKIEQADIDSLFDQVNESRMVTEWEKLSARNGLVKLFTAEGFRIPQPKELVLLNRVFGRDFTQAIMSKRTNWQKIVSALWETANIPRAVMASYDLSAPLRQGLFLIGEPKEFFSAFGNMFKYWGSEKAYRGLMEEIASRPNYDLMRRARLALTEMDSTLGLREERFMSHFAEKIPGVRMSSRAYTGFLNKLRADVFDKMIKHAESEGLNPRKNVALSENIADFVNAASGRGRLPRQLESMAVGLNATLFSPRLMASRIKLLNPIYYIKADPFVRRQALKSFFSIVGVGSAVLSLAKAAGWDVGENPFSPDFGKIKVGETRIDVWGGFQQYARTAFQLFGRKTVSSTTGKERKIGEGYPPLKYTDILGRWLEYKEAPVVSFAHSLLKGEGYGGKEFWRPGLGGIPAELGNRFVPMVIQDMVEIAKEDPDLLPISALGIFGVGLQTYGKQGKKTKVY